ncbi:proteasome subunit alpha type-6 [Drosophila persimilis]|uniref:proteasome subunit alpha type-6 n=1 Tax=Drosophila persimilis TaxID=7234 RepID=UPI000F08C2FE|nr:proteasome subunit alpha type-6 [Drosophila persimilis]
MSRLTAGLDQQITIFSPSGDLHQIDYARKAAALENTTVALKTKNAAVLATQKRITDKTIVPRSVKHLFRITPKIGCCMTGRIGDSHFQVRRSRNEASKFRYTCGYDVTAKALCERMADINQVYSQHPEIRPLGCSMILIEYDEKLGPTLHMTDPGADCNSYKGCGLGPQADQAEAFLAAHLKGGTRNMSEEKAIQLALECLGTVLDIRFEPLHLEVGIVSKAHPEFRMLDEMEIAEQLSNMLRSSQGS